MPQDSVYGEWPASGEIDLAESKGNDGATYPSGRDTIISALVGGLPALLIRVRLMLTILIALGSHCLCRCILVNRRQAYSQTDRLQRQLSHIRDGMERQIPLYVY